MSRNFDTSTFKSPGRTPVRRVKRKHCAEPEVTGRNSAHRKYLLNNRRDFAPVGQKITARMISRMGSMMTAPLPDASQGAPTTCEIVVYTGDRYAIGPLGDSLTR